MNKTSLLCPLLLAAVVYSTGATASTSVIYLDFEGIGDGANIQDFYNGGTDSYGNSGSNYGVTFGPDPLMSAFVNYSTTDGVAFEGEPSPVTVMGFYSGAGLLNSNQGFDTGFSFYYSTTDFTGQVKVYDGLSATGNVLGTIDILALGEGPNPNKPYKYWAIGSLSFNGIAKSVDFGDTENGVGFDNLTLGSSIPAVPELPTAGLLILGLGFLATKRRVLGFKI